jgi:four helix bundle protein
VQVVKVLYVLTRDWPKEEIYGLTAQVRRSAVSIPANLAEGVGRGTSAETARFTQNALGSLYELDTLLHIATELGMANKDAVADVRARLCTISRQISAFIRYQGTKRK